MATPVVIPDLGKSVEELKLVNWLKAEGQAVELDEPICEVETYKALGQLESPAAGVLLKQVVALGATVKPGQIVAFVGAVGEAVPDVSSFTIEPPYRGRIGPLGRQRLAVCAACDDYNGNVCEQLFPDGCCYTKWRQILDDRDERCPAGKWPPGKPPR